MKTLQAQDIGLFELMVAIIIILLLVLSISKMNIDKKSVIDTVSFEMAKQNFSQNTSLIRAQWLMEGRPNTLEFSFYIDQKTVVDSQMFELSNTGWPLLKTNMNNACRSVWLEVNNLNANDNIEQYVQIKKVKKDNDIGCQFCDAVHNDACIVYSPYSGIKAISQNAAK